MKWREAPELPKVWWQPELLVVVWQSVAHVYLRKRKKKEQRRALEELDVKRREIQEQLGLALAVSSPLSQHSCAWSSD